jgi:cobalt transporter subunit CbtA
MTRRIFFAGLIAGLIAGTLVTLVQAVKLAPLIHVAEGYEHALPASHDDGTPHEGAGAWEPEEGVERLLFTWVANLIVGSGFGLVLSAGFALRQGFSGEDVTASRGLAWGVAGFAAFALAPAVGLPPELPGSAAAALVARQAWWIGTALATAGAIALFFFGRATMRYPLALALLLLPHVVGAPAAPPRGSAVPAELAAEFVAGSLASAALFWLVLGGVGGWLFERMGRAA